MKRLWLSGLFLAALLVFSFYNAWKVENITSDIVSLLNQAEEAAMSDDWSTVERLTMEARTKWYNTEDYFSVMLVYAYVDEVSTSFEEVTGFLQYHDGPEYDSSNGTLVAKVEHLAEIESVNWKNIL